MLISNRDEIEGKKIVEEFGLVTGNTVQSRFFVRDFFAGIRKFLGLEVIEYTEMLNKTRKESMKRMVKEAKTLGANAILNVRFATSEISRGASELLCYGTAVKVVECSKH